MNDNDSVFSEILDELRSGDKYDTILAEKADAELKALRAEKERADRLEAMVDRMSETITELRFEVAEGNGLLRSAFSIALRDGTNTNWEAFRKQLDTALVRQLEMMNRHDIRPV